MSLALSRLALLRLASPALPVGAFSYSRGFEPAVEAGFVHDENSARGFILGLLEHSVVPLDAAMLCRFYAAWRAGDEVCVRELSERLRAFRESKELALEDEQMGLALARILDFDLKRRAIAPSYTCMFALAAMRWGIELEATLLGFLYAICESQISVALRLLPLGQTAGQRMLAAALPELERLALQTFALADDEIGNFTPGLALLSARHELQYSRLFRS